MTTEPAWVIDYFGGLHAIRLGIASVMGAAGADLTDACIRHPRIERLGAHPPPMIPIVVIPFNGPRHVEAFGETLVVKCSRGLDEEASAIIARYADAFAQFREQRETWLRSPERPVQEPDVKRVSTTSGSAQ